jgi:hypothetical protein
LGSQGAVRLRPHIDAVDVARAGGGTSASENEEGRPIEAALQNCRGALGYFNCVEMLLNLAFRLVPSPFTTAITATEIPAAIRPYSIAVAPDSHLVKAMNFSNITHLPTGCTLVRHTGIKPSIGRKF